MIKSMIARELLVFPLFLVVTCQGLAAAELAAVAPTDACVVAPGETKVGVACEAPAGKTRRSTTLVAGQGKVTFALPDGTVLNGTTLPQGASISVDDLMLYGGKLVPDVWRLNAGDVVDIKLKNELTPGDFAATNLHTHGLLVSPDLDIKPNPSNPGEMIAAEPVGDTVYVCTVPPGQPAGSVGEKSCTQHGDPSDKTHSRLFFGEKRDEMNYQIALPPTHPEGLFWYHPHIHGNARTQVGSGLSGLIFVKGKPDAGGAVGASGGARPQDPTKSVVERFLMLKDIQIGNVQQLSPSVMTASFLPVINHDSGLCSTPAAGAAPPTGVCFKQGDSSGWLFTVNGQVFPHLSVAAGEQQIWRIANTSADMTYDLALVELATGRPLRVQILARDGIAADAGGPNMTERVLMMPGSRIEIGVDRATAEGRFNDQRLEARLRSYGFFTGDGGTEGDAWPAVDLAQVSFAAEPSSAPAVIGAMKSRLKVAQPTATGPRKFQPFIVAPWKPGSDYARAVAPDRAKPMATSTSISSHPSMHMAGVDEHPQAPPKDGCENAAGREDRIIALAIHQVDPNKPEEFQIGADCAKYKGPDWEHRIDVAKGNATSFGKNSVVLRAHAGRSETWTIVNDPAPVDDQHESNHETHNFHVHQMKFQVVEVYDPTRRIGPPSGDPKASMVDSYPVPIGGYLRIRINFTKQMTGGRFVFHCHILEHEDKGMMAEIEVK